MFDNRGYNTMLKRPQKTLVKTSVLLRNALRNVDGMENENSKI